MADKVQKILSEITTRKLCTMDEHMAFYNDNAKEDYRFLSEVEELIKALQEEPVSSIWHDASEKSNEPEDVVIINPSDNTGEVLTNCTGVYSGRIWSYTSDLLNLDNPCKIGKNLQEEPVSEFMNTESMIESYKQRLISQTNGVKDSPLIDMCLASYKHGINETLDTLNLSNTQRTVKNRKEPVSEDLEEAAKHYLYNNILYDDVYVGEPTDKDCIEMFKAGVQWQKAKDESITEDLGEYINELSKKFPEISFAKLSRIVVRVSRWQRTQDTKNKLPNVLNRTDLDEYAYQCAYDMSNDWAIDNPTWHDAIAAKLGVPQNETPPVNVQYAEVAPQPSKKPAKKQKRTTGAITYQDSIQTSLFE